MFHIIKMIEGENIYEVIASYLEKHDYLNVFRCCELKFAQCGTTFLKNGYNEAYVHAVNINNQYLLKLYFPRVTNYNFRDSHGNMAVMYAARNMETGIMERLLKRGSKINSCNNNGDSVLMFGVDSCNMEIVRFILGFPKVDVNSKNSAGCNAVMLASHYGKNGIIRILLRHGANINTCAKQGDTALMIAVNGGHASTVKLLIKNKARLNDRNGKYTMKKLLKKRRKRMSRDKFKKLMNELDYIEGGNTALMVACDKGNYKIAKILIDAGADIHLINDFNGNALRLAYMGNHYRIVELLLNHGANTDKLKKETVTAAEYDMRKSSQNLPAVSSRNYRWSS